MDAPLTREQTTHVAQRCQTGPKNEKKKPSNRNEFLL